MIIQKIENSFEVVCSKCFAPLDAKWSTIKLDTLEVDICSDCSDAAFDRGVFAGQETCR
jgi:hypothetical protein